MRRTSVLIGMLMALSIGCSSKSDQETDSLVGADLTLDMASDAMLDLQDLAGEGLIPADVADLTDLSGLDSMGEVDDLVAPDLSDSTGADIQAATALGCVQCHTNKEQLVALLHTDAEPTEPATGGG